LGKNKIVVDTNVLIGALINPNSIVWSILEIKDIEFFVPEFFLLELSEYKQLIKEKLDTKYKYTNFKFLISELFRNIVLVPKEMYSSKLNEAIEIMKDIDEKDSPFIALAITLNCAIWSNDKDFKKQKKVKVYSTSELAKRVMNFG